MEKEMISKPIYKFFISLIIILSVTAMAGCSELTYVPTLTAIETSTTIPTKTPIPLATFTLGPEPSSTATLLPAVSLPTEVISSQNISELEQLDTRELADKPEDFFPRSMDFTPHGQMVAADYDTKVYVWDGLTGQLIVSFDHSTYLWNVAISPDGKMVASGGESGVIKLWNLKTGKEIHEFIHPGVIWSLGFSPDGTTLVSGTLDQSIKIWNVIDGKELGDMTDVIAESLAFSPDGKLLAIGTDDKIILWNVISKKPLRTLVFDLRGGEGLSGIQGVLFSPDGKKIAAADADNIATVWDVSSGKKLSTIIGTGTIIRMSEGALAFSPDSKMIATGNDNGDVIFWDVLADKELKTIGSQTCIPLDLIFWPNGNAFEIGCWNGTIQLWGLP
jgi:WD40 repeat protein